MSMSISTTHARTKSAPRVSGPGVFPVNSCAFQLRRLAQNVGNRVVPVLPPTLLEPCQLGGGHRRWRACWTSFRGFRCQWLSSSIRATGPPRTCRPMMRYGLSDVSRAFCERFVWRLCAGKALMSILSIWEFSRISSQPHVKVRPRFFSCICLQIKVRLWDVHVHLNLHLCLNTTCCHAIETCCHVFTHCHTRHHRISETVFTFLDYFFCAWVHWVGSNGREYLGKASNILWVYGIPHFKTDPNNMSMYNMIGKTWRCLEDYPT